MKQRFFSDAGLALVLLAVLVSVTAEEGGAQHDDGNAQEEAEPSFADRHRRAPRGLSLEVSAGTWLRAPGADWFAGRTELEPGRFTYNENALDGEAAWVDSRGVYHFRLDEETGVYAYWQWVSAEQLTRGRRDFIQYCASCHGFDGDGYGRSGQSLRPPPRDFRQSKFKFTKVRVDLPTDDALFRLINRGLDGTPMYQWDLSSQQLDDIVQYIKSLSLPERGWRDVYIEIGDVVESGEDPWEENTERARRRGEEVYHGAGTCYACHPGYVTSARLADIRSEAAGTKYREDLSYPALKTSEYQVGEKQIFFLPPDFTWHQMRSGTETLDLFETIASGIKGAAMPPWKGALSDKDLWALAHYVGGLIEDYKLHPAKRAVFMAGLRGE